MKIHINDKTITVPDELLPKETGPRVSHTSYFNEFKIKNGVINVNSDFMFRIACYNNLRKYLQGKYFSHLELFGGVGITAKMFEIDPDFTYVNDIDENCLKVLRQNFKLVCDFNILNFPYPKILADLVLADFNNFTVKKAKDIYAGALQEIFEHAYNYVIINDCSIFYLKYGKTSYNTYSMVFDKDVSNLEEFFSAEKEFLEARLPGWKLIRIEYFSNSSFLLFEKGASFEFNINKARKQNIIKFQNESISTNGNLWDREDRGDEAANR